MPELDLWSYGQFKWGQLCPMSVVVIGAIHQIFPLSPLWKHGRLYFLTFFVFGWDHVSSGQYVLVVHHSVVMYYFWAGMFICQQEPIQGSLFLLPQL